MCINDDVVIQDILSTKIMIGIILGDVYEISDESVAEKVEQNICPFKKRRKVKWIKLIRADKADVYLLDAIRSQTGISSLNKHKNIIERNMYSIFISNNKIHSIIESNGLNLKLANALFSSISECISSFSEQFELDINDEDIKVNINVNSLGLLELVAAGSIGSIVLCVATCVIFGAICGIESEIKIKLPGFLFENKIKMGGLISYT